MYQISSTQLLKNTMRDYFRSIGTEGRKVAWCTSVGPAELLRSFGFDVYFPENHGALLGATRTAMDYIPEAAKTKPRQLRAIAVKDGRHSWATTQRSTV